jgi:photosystem II stability/assembly factor-like uncharacterized protein
MQNKKIFTLFFTLLFVSAVFGQSGWFQQSPYPQRENLSCTDFLNALTGYAVGDAGTIIKTTNGGINWIILNSNTTQRLMSVDFIDENTGLVTGINGNILKTTDGGNNWTITTVNAGLLGVHLVNTNVAYIAGFANNNGAVLKTTNGGNNWIIINTGYPIGLLSVYFSTINNGCVAGSLGRILYTTNGGLEWKAANSDATIEQFWSIYFTDTLTGYIAGRYLSGVIFKTTDGGKNWIRFFTSNIRFQSIRFINAFTGYSAGSYGGILKTTDAGQSWVQQFTDRWEDLFSVSTINNDISYCVGAAGTIIKTTDGGNNWYSLFSGSAGNLGSMFFFDENTGLATGPLIKTTNGGNYWLRISQGGGSPIYFINNQTGYSVGSGEFYKTTNGGYIWAYSWICNCNLQGIYFINPDTGFVTGTGNGKILRTTNGGNSWDTVFYEGGFSVQFLNSQNGYVTSYGRVLKTTNAGLNWLIKNTGINEEILSEYFIDINTGYITGGFNGFIQKTTNGGDNWIQQYSGKQAYLKSIFFTNNNTGYAVGGLYETAVILKTINGGLNWFQQNCPNAGSLLDVKFINPNTGYACGVYGVILKTTTGGDPIGINRISNNIPKSFKLYQNYPNPFNPKTKIRFDISNLNGSSHSIQTLIVVFDVLGREVEKIVNEELKPGTYEIEFDANNYSSGVYFYKIFTEIFSETNKMILIR